MTWTACSHAYAAYKSHMNVQTAGTEWRDLSPLDIITTISDNMNIPIAIGQQEIEKLELPIQDSEGLRNRSNDDPTTSPIAFMQKVLDEQSIYMTTGEDGFLLATDFNTKGAAKQVSMYFIEGAEETQGNVSELFSMEVAFNYGELAKYYTVIGDRRKLDDARAVVSRSFPLPIFKNVERKYSSVGPEKVAFMEMSRTVSKAINIDMTVPGWINAGMNRPWRIGDIVAVRSLTHGIHDITDGEGTIQPSILLVTGVTLEASKDWARTKLSLHPPGVFDIDMFMQLPFLTYPGTVEVPVPYLYSGHLKTDDDGGIGKIITPDGPIDPDDYPDYLLGAGRGRVG